jgi:hypothetical protein
VPRRPRRRPFLALATVWAVLLAVAAVGVPRLVDAWRALEWTRFHCARVAGPRPGEQARRAGRAAARVVDLAAPLPWAREAARLALDAAGRLEGPNRPSALAAYEEVEAALDRARSSVVRGLGLGALAEEARAKADEARGEASPQRAPEPQPSSSP